MRVPLHLHLILINNIRQTQVLLRVVIRLSTCIHEIADKQEAQVLLKNSVGSAEVELFRHFHLSAIAPDSNVAYYARAGRPQ